MLNKITWFDTIGRVKRSTKNEKLENFLTDLQRLTIVHETDHGGSYYRFASGSATPNVGDVDKRGHAKSGETTRDEKKAREDHPGDGKDGGDKKSSDDSGKGDEKADNKPGQDQDQKTPGGGALDGDKQLSDHHGKGAEHVDLRQRQGQGQQQQQQRPSGQQQQRSQGAGGLNGDKQSSDYRGQGSQQAVPQQRQQGQGQQQRPQGSQPNLNLGQPVSEDSSSGEKTHVDSTEA